MRAQETNWQGRGDPNWPLCAGLGERLRAREEVWRHTCMSLKKKTYITSEIPLIGVEDSANIAEEEPGVE